MQQEALSPIMGRRLATALVKFELSAGRSAAIEDAVHLTLNMFADSPVPTIQYPFYLCFARSVARLRDIGINAATFDAEVALRKAMWVSRGLNADALDIVAEAV
jgi:hypothetical protein